MSSINPSSSQRNPTGVAAALGGGSQQAPPPGNDHGINLLESDEEDDVGNTPQPKVKRAPYLTKKILERRRVEELKESARRSKAHNEEGGAELDRSSRFRKPTLKVAQNLGLDVTALENGEVDSVDRAETVKKGRGRPKKSTPKRVKSDKKPKLGRPRKPKPTITAAEMYTRYYPSSFGSKRRGLVTRTGSRSPSPNQGAPGQSASGSSARPRQNARRVPVQADQQGLHQDAEDVDDELDLAYDSTDVEDSDEEQHEGAHYPANDDFDMEYEGNEAPLQSPAASPGYQRMENKAYVHEEDANDFDAISRHSDQSDDSNAEIVVDSPRAVSPADERPPVARNGQDRNGEARFPTQYEDPESYNAYERHVLGIPSPQDSDEAYSVHTAEEALPIQYPLSPARQNLEFETGHDINGYLPAGAADQNFQGAASPGSQTSEQSEFIDVCTVDDDVADEATRVSPNALAQAMNNGMDSKEAQSPQSLMNHEELNAYEAHSLAWKPPTAANDTVSVPFGYAIQPTDMPETDEKVVNSSKTTINKIQHHGSASELTPPQKTENPALSPMSIADESSTITNQLEGQDLVFSAEKPSEAETFCGLAFSNAQNEGSEESAPHMSPPSDQAMDISAADQSTKPTTATSVDEPMESESVLNESADVEIKVHEEEKRMSNETMVSDMTNNKSHELLQIDSTEPMEECTTEAVEETLPVDDDISTPGNDDASVGSRDMTATSMQPSGETSTVKHDARQEEMCTKPSTYHVKTIEPGTMGTFDPMEMLHHSDTSVFPNTTEVKLIDMANGSDSSFNSPSSTDMKGKKVFGVPSSLTMASNKGLKSVYYGSLDSKIGGDQFEDLEGSSSTKPPHADASVTTFSAAAPETKSEEVQRMPAALTPIISPEEANTAKLPTGMASSESPTENESTEVAPPVAAPRLFKNRLAVNKAMVLKLTKKINVVKGQRFKMLKQQLDKKAEIGASKEAVKTPPKPDRCCPRHHPKPDPVILPTVQVPIGDESRASQEPSTSSGEPAKKKHAPSRVSARVREQLAQQKAEKEAAVALSQRESEEQKVLREAEETFNKLPATLVEAASYVALGVLSLGEERFECPECRQQCVSKDHYQRHLHCHVEKLTLPGKKVLKCFQCNFYTQRASTMDAHIKVHKVNSSHMKKYQEEAKTMRKANADESKEAHAERMDFIKKRNSFLTNLKQEQKKQMDRTPPYKRSKFEFHPKVKLEHARLQNGTTKQLDCPTCYFKCTNTNFYSEHLERHGWASALYQCGMCDYGDNNLSVVEFHRLYHHNANHDLTIRDLYKNMRFCLKDGKIRPPPDGSPTPTPEEFVQQLGGPLFQCATCKFFSCTAAEMSFHLVDKHPEDEDACETARYLNMGCQPPNAISFNVYN